MGEIRADTIFFGKGSITQNRDMFQKVAVRDQLKRVGFKGTVTGKNTPLEQLARDTSAAKIRLERKESELRVFKEMNQKTEKLVGIDHLTGLTNTRRFEEQLKMEIEETKRTHTPFTLLFIDLDKFKMVNDTFGHEAGDRLLQAAAKAYQKSVRPYDIIGRVGGDEFAIILKGDLSQEEVEKFVRRINEIFDVYKAKNQHLPKIEASIGAAVFDGDPTVSEAKLLRRADDAMTNAKTTIGTTVHFWTPDTKRRVVPVTNR